MAGFLTSVGSVITAVIGWFGSICATLLTNEVFMLIVGIVVFGMLFGKIMGMVKSRKKR